VHVCAGVSFLEDPLGSFGGGNGATLWDCSLALALALEAARPDWRGW